jgi:hypothetical protein
MTIEVALNDQYGMHRSAGTASVSVLPDHRPVADAGGPYEVTLGQSIVLDATHSSDPDQPASSRAPSRPRLTPMSSPAATRSRSP